MAQRQQVNSVLRDIESVNDTVVSNPEAIAIAASEMICGN